jgi:hypothetical protein
VNGRFVIVGLILIGAALIAAAGRGTLWFDELLSLQWARSAQQPWHILELYRHDNNHPLNTLWLMLAGEDRHPWIYRGLSMVSGLVVLVLVWIAARRLSQQFAWVPLLLAATSFPLVLYASEARGYAPALACLLGAWLLVSAQKTGGEVWRVPLFWLLCLGALFSHGTSVVILAALGVYFLIDRHDRGETPARLAARAALWFGVPSVVSAVYWFFFLRLMMIAGGPEYSLPQVLGHFFGYAFGVPGAGSGPWSFAMVGFLLVAAALVWGCFPDRATRVFFVCAITVCPALSLLATDTTYLYFRYFLVSLPFVYLLAAPVADAFRSSAPVWKMAAGFLLAAVVAGQIPRLATLIGQERGDYAAALTRIASEPAAGRKIVSNTEMQVGFLLAHLKRSEPHLDSLILVPQARAAEEVADWIVYASQEDPPAVPQESLELHGDIYRAVSVHHSAPVSGSHWTVYRRAPASAQK